MTAHRATMSLMPSSARGTSSLALTLGAPASLALGFLGGWMLGALLLRPVQNALLAEAGA